jgi:choline-sulfatase
MIAIDDQNDWVGYLKGHPQARTPHIDSLAARGTGFTNAHCQSPLCNPSRTSLMTGRRPSSTGIYGLAPWFRTIPELKDIVTLPQYFMKQGYTTYGAGKIYHGAYGQNKKDGPVEWNHYGPKSSGAPFPPQKLVNTPQPNRLVDWGMFDHQDEDKGDYKIAEWTAARLDAKPKSPFFMACGFFLPHVPCYATQKWFDLFPEDQIQLPLIQKNDRSDTPRFSWYLHWKLPEPRLQFLEETDQWVNLTRSYLACTAFVDDQIGKVLASLKRNGFEDNTIVVLWSDHGWHIGEKEITGKNSLWDDGTHVPLIFVGPGVKSGQLCHQPVELLDIYPTLVDLCGREKVEGLEGLSLIPQLTDANTQRDHPAITTHNHDNHGIRSENWRYIEYANGSAELYDLINDPNEWSNVVNKPELKEIVAWHRNFLPKINKKPVVGSADRILLYNGTDTVNWEGKDVGPNDPIPEINQ